jgi:hypothetical protein
MTLFKKIMMSAAVCILALLAVFFLLNYQSGSAQEPKNPNLCPPGQEEQAGCKWCQHRVTGKCMWLPAEAVAGPWVEISPAGYCPPLQPEATSTATGTPTSTATSEVVVTPTSTATTSPTSTATTVVIITLTSTATDQSEPTTAPLITQVPFATPDPHPRPPRPGGTGNLGYIVLGATALLGLLTGGAILIAGIVRKQY